MNVEARSQHFQSQAVAMLAMATGAIGFGLFGAEFRVSTEFVPTFKLVAGGFVLVCYVAVAQSVKDIFESADVTGRDVATGPLVRLYLVVIYVACIFVADIFDNPAGSS